MARVIESGCVYCDICCNCGADKLIIYYCDICDDSFDADELYIHNHKMVCKDCLIAQYDTVDTLDDDELENL